MVLAKKRLDYLESKSIISPGEREKIENNPQEFVRELRLMRVNDEQVTDDIEEELRKIEKGNRLTKEEEEKIVERLEALGCIGQSGGSRAMSFDDKLVKITEWIGNKKRWGLGRQIYFYLLMLNEWPRIDSASSNEEKEATIDEIIQEVDKRE